MKHAAVVVFLLAGSVKVFLEDHPKIREDIKSHPNAFMKRYKKYEGSAADERQDARRVRRHRKG